MVSDPVAARPTSVALPQVSGAGSGNEAAKCDDDASAMTEAIDLHSGMLSELRFTYSRILEIVKNMTSAAKHCVIKNQGASRGSFKTSSSSKGDYKTTPIKWSNNGDNVVAVVIGMDKEGELVELLRRLSEVSNFARWFSAKRKEECPDRGP